MFRKGIFCVILCVLGVINVYAQNDKPVRQFIINGNVPGLDDGSEVSIICRDETMKDMEWPTATVKNGKFVLMGSVKYPVQITVATHNQAVHATDPSKPIKWTYTDLFLENTKYELSTGGGDGRRESLKVTGGGRLQKELVAFRKNGRNRREFMKQYPQSILSVQTANDMMVRGYHLTKEQIDELETIVTGCPDRPELFADFQKRIAAAKKTTAGAPLASLEIKDTNSKVIDLKDIQHNGKYLIIDFWASWCGMCIHAMPEVKAIQEKYADRADLILVSCDKEEDRWRNGMERINMPYPHYIMTPKGYDDFYFNTYQVRNGVPYYLVVDPEGHVYEPSGHASSIARMIDNRAHVSGIVKGSSEKPKITVNLSMEHAKPIIFDINDDGTFKADIDLPYAKEAFLTIDDERGHTQQLIYLTPSRSLVINVNSQGEETVVTYDGDTAPETDYLNISRNIVTMSQTFSQQKLATLPDFKACKEYVRDKMRPIVEAKRKIRNSEFIDELNRKDDHGAQQYFSFAIAKQLTTDMKQDTDFMDYVKSINFNDTTNQGALLQYLNWHMLAYPEDVKPGEPQYASQMRILGKVVQNQDMRNVMGRTLYSSQHFYAMLGVDISKDLPVFYEEYLKVSTDPQTTEMARKQIAIIKNKAVGTMAADIKLVDQKGKRYSLRDVIGKGKYSYIDLWATWCVPCLKETPSFVEKMKEYKDIRFVSISIDEDETKWKAKMEKDKPDWPHYLISRENATAFADIYGVTSIPRFMIFDKEGKMMMDNAPRPSEVKIDSVLNGMK